MKVEAEIQRQKMVNRPAILLTFKRNSNILALISSRTYIDVTASATVKGYLHH